jgi:hypothetical protein
MYTEELLHKALTVLRITRAVCRSVSQLTCRAFCMNTGMFLATNVPALPAICTHCFALEGSFLSLRWEMVLLMTFSRGIWGTA